MSHRFYQTCKNYSSTNLINYIFDLIQMVIIIKQYVMKGWNPVAKCAKPKGLCRTLKPSI